jgi:hypothetical protein
VAAAMRDIIKAWDIWAVFAITVAAVIVAVVVDQSPLLVFTLVALALCAYMAIRLSRNDFYKVPSTARVATGAFGFLIFSHAFDGPDLQV